MNIENIYHNSNNNNKIGLYEEKNDNNIKFLTRNFC